MSVDPKSVGTESSVSTLRYDWKTLALYALGIGAKRDELDYLYEGRGPKAYPTFAVVPAYPVLGDWYTQVSPCECTRSCPRRER
jgi:hypothetical protein